MEEIISTVNHSLLREYISTLKHPKVEETVDMFFFRPLAFICVKLSVAFNSRFFPHSGSAGKILAMTPNKFSFLALLSGLFSGYFFVLFLQV